ncbi:hypothetical protein [Helicobacter japonicus]|uniref:hypothetical protein n=1 Tax=Helicobacter japonicus TaxID=425400 RepID=UPI0023F165C2|nr:hypothetical protein [Helicobacter japonicus]
MKFGLSIVLSLGLALSPLCALDSSAKLGVDSKKAVANTSLSSADADFLFTSNANLNVVALSGEEMRLTEGEGWFSRFFKGLIHPRCCLLRK